MNEVTAAWASRLLWLLPAALFLSGALQAMAAHGLYMDAVNPDYLVARLLGGHRNEVPAWVMPGNLIAARFPLLIQVYHGALPFWLGLPFYALLGTQLEAVRLVHAIFALGVLASLGVFLRAFAVPVWLAVAACALLALDPAFLLAFRTQFYITLMPLAFVLLSAAVTERRGPALLAGFLAGVAVHGYFIHAVFLPVLLAHAAWRGGTPAALRWLLGAWIAGGSFLAGFAMAAAALQVWPVALALPVVWVLGCSVLWQAGRVARPWRGLATLALGAVLAGLLALSLAPAAWVAPLHRIVETLEPGRSSLGLLARLEALRGMSWLAWAGTGGEAMLLGHPVPPGLAPWRLVLLAVPVTAALLLQRRNTGLTLTLGLLLAHVPLALAFGDRLWAHHLVALPVLAVAALALALARLPRWSALVLLPLLLLAGAQREQLLAQLRQEGGQGLSAMAIIEFSRDVVLRYPAAQLHTPDWGVMLPFIMESGGRIAVTTRADPAEMHDALCRGRPQIVALLASQGFGRLAELEARLGPAETRRFNETGGAPLLLAAYWRDPAGCAAPADGATSLVPALAPATAR